MTTRARNHKATAAVFWHKRHDVILAEADEKVLFSFLVHNTRESLCTHYRHISTKRVYMEYARKLPFLRQILYVKIDFLQCCSLAERTLSL